MPPTATAPTKPAGLKKFNLGAIAPQGESSTKKDYPVLPDPDGELAKLVAELRAKSDQLDALDGEVVLLKGEITSKARPFWFEANQGKADEGILYRVNGLLVEDLGQEKCQERQRDKHNCILRRAHGLLILIDRLYQPHPKRKIVHMGVRT